MPVRDLHVTHTHTQNGLFLNDSLVFYRRHSRRNIILTRRHAICRHVRSNGSSAHIHDLRFPSRMPRSSSLDSHIDHFTGVVRNVFRIRHIRHLRTRKKCHTIGIGKFLSDTFAQR